MGDGDSLQRSSWRNFTVIAIKIPDALTMNNCAALSDFVQLKSRAPPPCVAGVKVTRGYPATERNMFTPVWFWL